jgi:hypothetical protein
MRAAEFSYWFRRWVRATPAVRTALGRPSLRYHLGEPNELASARAGELLIWAYCGLTIYGNGDASSMSEAFETCPLDCDEALHCRQCARSLARRLAGRGA